MGGADGTERPSSRSRSVCQERLQRVKGSGISMRFVLKPCEQHRTQSATQRRETRLPTWPGARLVRGPAGSLPSVPYAMLHPMRRCWELAEPASCPTLSQPLAWRLLWPWIDCK